MIILKIIMNVHVTLMKAITEYAIEIIPLTIATNTINTTNTTTIQLLQLISYYNYYIQFQ